MAGLWCDQVAPKRPLGSRLVFTKPTKVGRPLLRGKSNPIAHWKLNPPWLLALGDGHDGCLFTPSETIAPPISALSKYAVEPRKCPWSGVRVLDKLWVAFRRPVVEFVLT